VFVTEWYNALAELAPSEPLGELYWQRLMTVKTAVNKVLEGQRRDGLVGGTLEAEVTLYCDGELAQLLQALGDELRFVLITSRADVQPLSAAPAGALASEVEGLTVAVRKSAAAKCARCWHHRVDIGKFVAHPELCGRCVENVDGAGEVRLYA
jgi:isoleucyl-tRNA synthetase